MIDMNRFTAGRAILAAAMLSALPKTTAAQECAAGVEKVGSIGISLLDCDCVIGAPFTNTEWKFRSEPRIAQIESNSPASGQLRVGDVIKSVGGAEIMTSAGARLLSVLKPGQPIGIVVERNGETVRRVLTAEGVCADDPDLLGTYASRVALTEAMMARSSEERAALAEGRVAARGEALSAARANAERAVIAQGGRIASTSVARANERAATAQGRAMSPTVAARADQERATAARAQDQATTVESARRAQEVAAVTGVLRATRALPLPSWIGLGFSCGDCSVVQEESGPRWAFRTPPTVYSVEVGSPAYGGRDGTGMRRGDVLTHVDGLAITTPAGGKRLGSVKPGETIKLRYRRPMQGGNPMTRELTIVAGQSRAPTAEAVSSLNRAVVAMTSRDAALAQTMRSYEETRRLETEQQQELANIVQRLRSATTGDQQKQAELRLSEVMATTAAVQRRQNMLVEELVATQRSGEVLEASRQSLSELALTPTVRDADRRLRYSGVFGENDVEVRGLSSVVVTERGDELIITTSDATIRLKKPVVRRD